MHEMAPPPSMPTVRYLPEPELIPPCPGCGDRTRVRRRVFGPPALPPDECERDRIEFASNDLDGNTPAEPWFCPACQDSFSWTYPFDYTLPVPEPWVWLLIEGRKTWELNHLCTKVRGPVGLSPAGSGAIAGMAELVDVHGPFTTAELRDHQEEHRIDGASLHAFAAGGRLYAWEFQNARRFERPVPYQHPQQPVIWVKLSVA